MPQGETVNDKRHMEIVVTLDLGPQVVLIDEMKEKLGAIATKARAWAEGKGIAFISDISVRAKTVVTITTSSCFEIVFDEEGLTVEDGCKAADGIARFVCFACREAGIPVSDGYAEIRITTSLLFSTFLTLN